MKFYRYWAKANEKVQVDGSAFDVIRYGWSNVSTSEALAKAKELCSQTVRIFRSGDVPGGYLYSDRPLREEIVEDFGDQNDPYAVITRNAYGCEVLNTSRVFFADVDLPRKSAFSGSFLQILSQLFASAEKKRKAREAESQQILSRIEQRLERSPGLGMRIYRTAAGYRCIETTREYDPMSDTTADLLNSLGSDPLYVKLCQVQECFRARLSPKCWRCGGERPTVRFPWADEEEEKTMRAWESKYRKLAEGYSTCEFIRTLGTDEMHPNVSTIVRLHDEMCCRPGLPLA